MAFKKLKFNMIFGGSHYAFGTVLEEEVIPLNLRKAKYLLEPDEVNGIEQMEEEFIEDEEEEPPPPKVIRKKR